MPQGVPRPGEKYLHFKDKLYQVIAIAQHSETGEKMVVYQALYGKFQIYVRPFDLFVSPVDNEKYPQVKQKYRFQLVEFDADAALSTSDESERKISRGEGSKKLMGIEDKMMAFFDAETIAERYEILLDMQEEVTDRMINNMAVFLDVVIEEGPLDVRFEDLKRCLRTMQKYECARRR